MTTRQAAAELQWLTQLVTSGRLRQDHAKHCLSVQSHRGGPEHVSLATILVEQGLFSASALQELISAATPLTPPPPPPPLGAADNNATQVAVTPLTPPPPPPLGAADNNATQVAVTPLTPPPPPPPGTTDNSTTQFAATPLTPPPPPPLTPSPAFQRQQADETGEASDPEISNLPADVVQALSGPNERISHYVMLGELGRGGMGVVYRAYDLELNRQVAIKMILDPARAGEVELARFQREAEAAARLRHPGIVSVHEVGEHEGKPYLVMDFIAGQTLEDELCNAEPTPKRIAEVLRELALALEHAHDQGVVHRDIKPPNLLIDENGKPHLMDFGIARDQTTKKQLTVTGQVLGTPAYMAPEQAGGSEGKIGPHTDIYATGAVLYRSLIGCPPFDESNALAMMHKILYEDPKRPVEHGVIVHPDLETIALKCLEKDPARRYESAAILAAELGRFLDGQPIAARPLGRLELAKRWGRRNKLKAAVLILAGAASLAAAVGMPTLWAWNRRAREQAAADARATLVTASRQDATRTAEAFTTALGQPIEEADDVTARRNRLDRLLALGLDALQASTAHVALATKDIQARIRLFDTALAVGEVAQSAEQWSVAASAFRKATSLDMDTGRAKQALDDVAVARNRVAEERRQAVETVLEDARSGETAQRAGGYDDALFTLVRYPDAQTVGLVASALDEVSASLRAVTREIYLSAVDAGQTAEQITSFEATLERVVNRPPGEVLSPADQMWLQHTAGVVLESQNRLSSTPMTSGFSTSRSLLAARQQTRLGPERLLLAKLCCQALGRLNIRHGALPALGRYLVAEADPLRAVHAGIALCLLGGDVARDLLLSTKVNRTLGGIDGAFWRQVKRYEVRLGVAKTTGDESAMAWLSQAMTLQNTGDSRGAMDAYDHALELDPTLVDAWMNRSTLRFRLGDLAGAEDDATRAIELAPPDEPRTWSNRAALRVARGNSLGALADAERAVAIDPELALAWGNRGNAHVLLGESTEAIADFSHAIELAPQAVNWWTKRANARLITGDLQGALTDFQRAIELDPQDSFGWTGLGRALVRLGDPEQAISALNRALEINPRDALAWTARGLAHKATGNLDAASSDLSRALDLDPSHVPAWVNRAITLAQAGNYSGAIADASKAIALSPASHGPWFIRGVSRVQIDDDQGATSDLTHFLELAPDAPQAQLARDIIAEIQGGR